MRQIRKLYLQNGAGERWGLNGENGIYASGLTGFGFSMNRSFADLNHGFFLPVSAETEPQHPIPFTLTFTKNPYQTYRHFVDWLSTSAVVTLVYRPFGTAEFFRDVVVNFVQKNELSKVGWLEIPCSFLCLAPWYLPAPTVLSLEGGNNEERKRYTYRYSPDLRYGPDSTGALSGTVAASGHLPAALEISYCGAIVNPSIRLTGDVSGKTYGICSVDTTLEASDTLKFSARYERSFVSKVTASGAETDLLDELELSTNPFFRVPVDEPCTLSIEADSVVSGKAQVLIYYYFRSV